MLRKTAERAAASIYRIQAVRTAAGSTCDVITSPPRTGRFFARSIDTGPDTVRAADVAFIRRERIPESNIPETFWPGAPALAVEVVGPGDTYDEVEEKIEDWLEAGA